MRYRALDANGDYIFGFGPSEFLQNSPEAVAQAVMTRLNLKTGEWFLDTSDGTPYATDVVGVGTKPLYDAAIRERILDTQSQGQNVVNEIISYSSSLDPTTRKLSINATIDTIYGEATLALVV